MRRRSFSRWGALASAGVMALGLTAGSATASTQYPVPYNFAANIAAAATQPGSSPPGSNNWSCKPTRAHPQAVVLVHGLLANETDNWQTMSPLLANNGYCVFALTYGVAPNEPGPNQYGGVTSMEQSATELSAFVDKVLATTHTTKVDIVGHSEGATMPDYYIEYLGGAAKVHRYVGVSGVKHGTTLDGLNPGISAIESLFPGASTDPTASFCQSCGEFLVGSAYIHKIEARAPAPGVVYTNIATDYDELVTPHTTSFMTGRNVTNITLQDHCALDFSEHLSIISSPITGQYILNALDPAHAAPVPCVPVLPVFGSGA